MGAVHGKSNSDKTNKRPNPTLFPAETCARRERGAGRTFAFVARERTNMVAALQRLIANFTTGIMLGNVVAARNVARFTATEAGLVDRLRAVGTGAVMAFVPAAMLSAGKPLQTRQRAQVLGRFLVLQTATNGPLGLAAWAGDGDNARAGRTRTCVAAFITDVTTRKSTTAEIATTVGRKPGIEFRILLLSTETKVAIWNGGVFLVAVLATN